jgi:hypothetical protein
MNSVNSFPPPAKPNFNFAAEVFCRGPERWLGASLSRVDPPSCRGALFANVRFHLRVVHQDPQAGGSKTIRPRAGRKRERSHTSPNFGSGLRAQSQKFRRVIR